uniref:Uncharacterized protein n=1 Tax=viral metagenome TaxID=1070528 RepID=A0A6M3M8H1_9ZZZZ
MKFEIDTSTINQKKLNLLPAFKKPETYSVQKSLGNGCMLDPPGYPTYFTQHVYTAHGNSPAKGVQMIIFDKVVEHTNDWDKSKTYDVYRAKIDKRLKNLWDPLPLDHPRTRAWILSLYTYFKHCYADDSNSEMSLIYPVPSYELKQFNDDERFSEEWRTAEQESIRIANKEIIDYAKSIAIPENHQAVRRIRKFYPEYEPEEGLIQYAPVHHGNWWERHNRRPKPNECPGQYETKHPVNGTWCQMCGWRDK